MKKIFKITLIILAISFNHSVLACCTFVGWANTELGATHSNDNNGGYVNAQMMFMFINAGVTLNPTEDYFLKKAYVGVTLPAVIFGEISEYMGPSLVEIKFSASNRGYSFDSDYKYFINPKQNKMGTYGYYLKAGYSLNFKSSDYSQVLLGIGYVF